MAANHGFTHCYSAFALSLCPAPLTRPLTRPLADVRCQTALDGCKDRPPEAGPACGGRGLCVSGGGPGRHTCLCQPGWKGVECELPVDQCRPLAGGAGGGACRNGATCVNRRAGFECECAPGFVGSFCERLADECLPRPCAEGATCVDLFNDYRSVAWSHLGDSLSR